MSRHLTQSTPMAASRRRERGKVMGARSEPCETALAFLADCLPQIAIFRRSPLGGNLPLSRSAQPGGEQVRFQVRPHIGLLPSRLPRQTQHIHGSYRPIAPLPTALEQQIVGSALDKSELDEVQRRRLLIRTKSRLQIGVVG